MFQEKLSREDLLQAALDHERVSNVEIKKVVIPKAMGAGKHFHPWPKNKTILHFDNASADEPLVFIAFYLKEAGEDLIKMLD